MLIAIMVVTGPSTSASMVLFLLQSYSIFQMATMQGVNFSTAPILACFWRFLIRHTFFVTNHACAFSRLQYSAAFVATAQFHYVNGGLSLFLNTFGWEILGFLCIRLASRILQRPHLLKFYCFYQLLETFCSCVSVSLLRRHLMVWATFAPRFLFSAIFLGLNCMVSFVLLGVEALL
jgi:phosphatidylinositol glycan class O